MKNNKNLIIECFPNLSLISTLLELERALKNCDSILDLGCGPNSPLRFINAKKYGVDGHEPSITQAKLNKTHDKYKLIDIRKIKNVFAADSFDAVVALDLIEHLPKKDGYQLLKDMERIAKKKIIVLTPNGFIPQKSEDGDLQEHLSGWDINDFKKNGYVVTGVLGHKFLRGEKHALKFEPKIVWGLISELTNILYTRNSPQNASALLSIKHLGKGSQ